MNDRAKRAAALIGRAMAAGVDLAQDAWRDAGVVLGLCTLAGAAVFVADHGELSRDLAHAMRIVGWGSLAFLLGPKLGALYRTALGGRALEELGSGGLQWTRLEWRLLGTVVALTGFAALLFAPLLGVGVAVLALLRPLGVVELGPLGPLGIGFLLVAPLFLALAAALVVGLARLAVTLPAEAAEGQPRFARGWFVTRGEGLAAGGVALATFLTPLLALWVLQMALDGLQAGGGAVIGAVTWPVPDAVVAGLVLAGLSNFLAAPFCVGAFADLYAVLAPAADAREAALAAASPTVAGEAQPIETLPVGEPDLAAFEEPPASTSEDSDGPEEVAALASRRARLRLVHSAEWPGFGRGPLAPAAPAREAGAATTWESPEPFGP